MQAHSSRRIVAWLSLIIAFAMFVTQATAQQGQTRGNTTAGNRGTYVANNTPVQRALPQRAPFQISAEHARYLDSVLNYWEKSSSQIKLYECNFTRWQYDPVFARVVDPKTGHLMAKTIASGVIKFAEPDKGLYEVEKQYRLVPPRARGDRPTYAPAGEIGLEKWICDGKAVFEFDYPRKRLVERPLPEEMQGKAIAEGPLPFLFGAKAEQIKERYWVRVITPKDTKDEYWLEVHPKRQEDAARYKKVEVILSKEPFLPKAIHIYDVNYDPRQNPARSSFAFENRKINPSDYLNQLDLLKLFHKEFFRPDTPGGWEKTVLKFDDGGGGQRTVSPQSRPVNRAQRSPSTRQR